MLCVYASQTWANKHIHSHNINIFFQDLVWIESICLYTVLKITLLLLTKENFCHLEILKTKLKTVRLFWQQQYSLFSSKWFAIIRDLAVRVGVRFDCSAADETRVSLLFFESGWLALLREPNLPLSVGPVKVMRGSLYHRLSAVSDAIE